MSIVGSGGAEIHAVDSLHALLGAFQRMPADAQSGAIALQMQARSALATLRQRAETARESERRLLSEIASVEHAIANTDREQSTSHLEGRLATLRGQLQATRDRIKLIAHWTERAEGEFSRFEGTFAALQAQLNTTVLRGQAVLRDKLDSLDAYRAVTLDRHDVAGSLGPSANVTAAATDSTHSQSLNDFALPAGFRWVPLAEIDLERELRGIESFAGAPLEAMRQSMERLRDDVLPVMQRERAHSSETFRAMDEQSGTPHESGLQRVYDAFFGRSDYVYLQRGRSSSHFEIVNGRHRIKVARDLGWEAIPAQVKDLRP